MIHHNLVIFFYANVWEMHVLLPHLCLSKRLDYDRNLGYISSEDAAWSSGKFPDYDRAVDTGGFFKSLPTRIILRFCEDV